MLNMYEKEPEQGIRRDPFTGFQDVPERVPWWESQEAPAERPDREGGRPSPIRPVDRGDYPEYYLG